MQIVGHLTEVQHVPQYINPRTGEIGSPAHTRLHVLDGTRDIYTVRVPDGWAQPLPTPGPVTLDVTVRAYSGRGGPGLSVTLNSVVSEQKRSSSAAA